MKISALDLDPPGGRTTCKGSPHEAVEESCGQGGAWDGLWMDPTAPSTLFSSPEERPARDLGWGLMMWLKGSSMNEDTEAQSAWSGPHTSVAGEMEGG